MKRISPCLMLLATSTLAKELFLYPQSFDHQETVLNLDARSINENLCNYAIDGTFYNLKPLINREYDYNVSLQSEGYSYKVLFNFCQTIREESCGLDKTLAGMVYLGDQKTCYNLSSGPGPRTGVDIIQSFDRQYNTQTEKKA